MNFRYSDMMKRAANILLVLALALAGAAETGRAQGRSNAQRPTPTRALLRRAIENTIRAVEVYEDTGTLKNAAGFIASIENDLEAVKPRLTEDHPLLQKPEEVRYLLARAEIFSRANSTRQRLGREESALLSEMIDAYQCRGAVVPVADCLKKIMAEVRDGQRAAFIAAVDSGLYSP